MRAALVCIGASLMLASCVSINDRPPERREAKVGRTDQVRGAISGQRQLIANFYATAADCSSLGYPTLKLAVPPQHGQVSVEQSTASAMFSKDDPRSSCNGRQVPATVIFYTSEPGFRGADTVAFDRIGVAGAYGYHVYTINVR